MPGRLFMVLSLACLLGAWSWSAQAQEASEERATALYLEAKQAFEADQSIIALSHIDGSLLLLPSPNSELLRAHILGRLGRLEDAHAGYERALLGATQRLNAGETRFEATVAEAGRSLALLRARLAEVTVEVRGAQHVAIEIDGKAMKAVELPNGSLGGTRWLSPGAHRVAVVGAGKTRLEQLDLVASQKRTVVVELSALTSPPAASATSEPSYAPPTASWITGAVGLTGMGVFATFAGLAQSVDDDLEVCSPRCPETLRDDARRGEAFQVSANVGLAVGATGLLAAVVIWAVDAASAGGSTEPGVGRVGPEGVFVRF